MVEEKQDGGVFCPPPSGKTGLRLNVRKSFATMATNLPSCFIIQLLEQLQKFLLNVVEISQVSEKLWLFNHKRADF